MTHSNQAKMAQAAYGANSAAARTDRGTEYAVISQITRQMKAAAEQGRAGFPALAEALHANRRLWTRLATGVAAPDNELPDDLRARIFFLAEFTFQHTGKVLAGKALAAPLVEINVAVMRGLLGQTRAEPDRTSDGPPPRPSASVGGAKAHGVLTDPQMPSPVRAHPTSQPTPATDPAPGGGRTSARADGIGAGR